MTLVTRFTMYNMRNITSVLGLIVLINYNLGLRTDWYNGARDPFGPYPRIPDKDLLKVNFTTIANLSARHLDIVNFVTFPSLRSRN